MTSPSSSSKVTACPFGAKTWLLSDSLALFRAQGAFHDIAIVLWYIIQLLNAKNEKPPKDEIDVLLDECVALAESVGDKRLAAERSCLSSYLALRQGDIETAYPLVSQGVAFYRRDGDKREIACRLPTLVHSQER